MIHPPRIQAALFAWAVVLAALPVHAGPPASSDPWDLPGAGATMGAPMGAPMAIAARGDRVYVADLDGDRIHVFTGDGRWLSDWGRSGSGPEELGGPAGIAVGPDGSLYVSDLGNHRVQRFASDGRVLGGWSLGDEAQPFGVAVDAAGRVYVTDLDAGAVSVWTDDGDPLASFGVRGSGPGQLLEPWGIVVDGSGDVWVADHGNHRIQRFSAAGVWQEAWGDKGLGEGQMLGPMGLALGRDGALVVTDLMGRVRSFSRSGGVTARGMAIAGGAGLLASGVAFDDGGDLLLVGPSATHIDRITLAPVAGALPTPTAFALLPIVQPMGHGPVALEMAIPGPGMVSADVFSLDGRRVYAVPRASCTAGRYSITWNTTTADGRNAATGMYFVRVMFEDGARRSVQTGRVLVLR
jgi:DNA-binding beta-propeller fold protein YncE